jgi:hypothetical protein
MQSLIDNSPYSISIRATPWDSRAFGLDTFEVSLDVSSHEFIDAATRELNELTNISNPAIFYGRINANKIHEKIVLLKSNFFACETQLQIFNTLSGYRAPKELGARRMPINKATDLDYIDVCKVAENTFSYSRFHEDPFVSKNLANIRMKSWSEDMQRNETPLLVSRGKGGEIDSFIFYKVIDDKRIELILGGSVPGKGALTPVFWASLMEHFCELGYKYIETKISASNVSILNIYLFFQFKVKNTYIDFHKHIHRDPLRGAF